MKGAGYLLLGVGAVLLTYALKLDTSVVLPYGAGWPNRVENLSLIEQRRTYLMLAGGTIIVGTLLIGFGSLRHSEDDDEDYRACPYCAEPVRNEAVICRHCRSELPSTDVEEGEEPELLPEPEEVEEPEDDGAIYSYRALREAAEEAADQAEAERGID